MERIAVGVDGSAGSASALAWAGGLAAATGAELVLVNALPRSADTTSPAERSGLVESRRAHVRDNWAGAASGARVSDVVVREGDPRDVVLPAAEAARADLLVLGRTGSGGSPGFLHLGSVVEHAIHHTPLPLAVIPAGWRPGASCIAVGVDGSAASCRALRWVGELAPALGASLVAVRVHEPVLEWTPVSSAENWRREVEREIEEWARPAIDAGVKVTAIAQRDVHPADGLLGAAAMQNADVVVIGTRGLGGISGLRAGGVTLKVLHRATVPLIVVPVS